jgi:hypothetical protein
LAGSLRGFAAWPLLPGDALGVGAQRYVYGVPCPFGDLRRVSAGVEPGGHGGMPQVVGVAGDKRCCLAFGECGGAGLVENDEIGAAGHDSAARQAETFRCN